MMKDIIYKLQPSNASKYCEDAEEFTSHEGGIDEYTQNKGRRKGINLRRIRRKEELRMPVHNVLK